MIRLVENAENANAITHAGSFHADDIFATIFLSKLQDIDLYRMEEWNEKIDLTGKIVYDIGFGAFDHHGENARKRENGIKYSSFGLLFEKYGKDYLKQKGIKDIEGCYQKFLYEFVMQIDAFDNGVFPENKEDYTILSLASLIELFNKTWKESKTTNDAFLEALQIGEKIFDRIEKRILDKLDAKEFVDNAILKSNNHILILEKYMPFMDFVLASKEQKATTLLYAIYPSNRRGYNIQAIRKDLKSYETRLAFPKEWGGKSARELQRLTTIPTFRFCHLNLFLCATDTLEDAIQVANLAISKNEK